LFLHSYKVHSISARPGFGAGGHSIRRYSDFTWLSEQLARDFPGVIVPPLPEKLAVGRFGEEFVESRRRALEKFLHRVAAHGELSTSPHFITFLQADEAGLAAAKAESRAASKTKGNTSAVSWLEGTVNTLTTSKVSGLVFILIIKIARPLRVYLCLVFHANRFIFHLTMRVPLSHISSLLPLSADRNGEVRCRYQD
jgi:hypothetical protein